MSQNWVLILVKKEHILAIFTAIFGVTQKLSNPNSYSLLGEIGCKSGQIMSNYSFLRSKSIDDNSQHHLRKSGLKVKLPKNDPKLGFNIGSKEHILTPKIAILGVTHKLPNPYSYPILGKIGCKGAKKMSKYPSLGP